MKYSKIQEQIISQLQRGDKKEISKRTGYSQPVICAALKKSNVSEMTSAEVECIKMAVRIIRERRAKERRLIKNIYGTVNDGQGIC